MTEADRKTHNAERLTELFPVMRERITAILAALEADGLRPRIQEAWRSPADELRDFERGTSHIKFGFHNITTSGGKMASFAADILDDDHPTDMGSPYLLRLAALAEEHSCETGIRWTLPQADRAAIDTAIREKEFGATVKIGFDPSHCEPSDFTLGQAEALAKHE